eukprot:361183-Chlamydomonas_euryale.AAC.2
MSVVGKRLWLPGTKRWAGNACCFAYVMTAADLECTHHARCRDPFRTFPAWSLPCWAGLIREKQAAVHVRVLNAMILPNVPNSMARYSLDGPGRPCFPSHAATITPAPTQRLQRTLQSNVGAVYSEKSSSTSSGPQPDFVYQDSALNAN